MRPNFRGTNARFAAPKNGAKKNAVAFARIINRELHKEKLIAPCDSCASAFAAQTQTDLYTSSTYEAGVSCDLLNPSIWKVGSADGEQFAGSVAETADNINFLNISHSMPTG